MTHPLLEDHQELWLCLALTVLKFVKSDTKTPSVTAQLLARKDLLLNSAEELMRKRAALEIKGKDATPEEMADFLAQAEFLSSVQAGFHGNRADVARALNALKSTARVSDRIAGISSVIADANKERTRSMAVRNV